MEKCRKEKPGFMFSMLDMIGDILHESSFSVVLCSFFFFRICSIEFALCVFFNLFLIYFSVRGFFCEQFNYFNWVSSYTRKKPFLQTLPSTNDYEFITNISNSSASTVLSRKIF